MNKPELNYNETIKDTGSNQIISVDISVDIELVPYAIKQLENIVCRAKETLNQQVVKQKIWDQKEENPVVQPEQGHSTHSNDQKSQEKEQLQKTIKTNNKQYIVTYPLGITKCYDTGITIPNVQLAENVIVALREGKDISIPNTWKVQVIDL